MSGTSNPLKPHPLTAAPSQWGRLGQAIGRTIDRARGTPDQPTDARTQLDDADLAFAQLLADVNSVMKTPVVLPQRATDRG
jgi:hypothetical protein